MGDGVVDNRELRQWVDGEGYDGPIEVEIFNEDVWATPADEAARIIAERFEQLVLPSAC